jgi:hypothetical protein
MLRELQGAQTVIVKFFYSDPHLIPAAFHLNRFRSCVAWQVQEKRIVMERERRSTTPLRALLAEEQYFLQGFVINNEQMRGYATRFLFSALEPWGGLLEEASAAFDSFAQHYSWNMGAKRDSSLRIKCIEPEALYAFA